MAAKKTARAAKAGKKTAPKSKAKPKSGGRRGAKKAAKRTARKTTGRKAKPKTRSKSKKRGKFFSSLEFHPTGDHFFYLYLALLPLLAVASLNFDAGIWTRYATFISPEDRPSAHLAYNLFSSGVFFGSPIFSLFAIRNTRAPKSRVLTWFLVLDVPVLFALDAWFFGTISWTQMCIAGFVIEVVAFVAAVVWLRVISWKITLLLAVYALAVLFSFYGVETARALLGAGRESMVLFGAGLVATLFGYRRILGDGDSGARDAVQIEMSNFAMIIMLATWCLAAVVLFAAMAG